MTMMYMICFQSNGVFTYWYNYRMSIDKLPKGVWSDDIKALRQTWSDMKQRCYNHKLKKYHRYGGRGISVSIARKESLLQFITDMWPRPKGYSLDRIDNDGDYCKENCRRASSRTQDRNKSTNIFYKGKCLKDRANAIGLKKSHTITNKANIRFKWNIGEAIEYYLKNGIYKPWNPKHITT